MMTIGQLFEQISSIAPIDFRATDYRRKGVEPQLASHQAQATGKIDMKQLT